MLFIRKTLLMAMFIIIAFVSNAQKIVIKDVNTNEPIAHVNCAAPNFKTASDNSGALQLPENTKHVTLTHISYQPLHLMGALLDEAKKTGQVLMTPNTSYQLEPVTIYGIKGKGLQQQAKLANGDWVQHDAGQVLQQVTGFSAIRKTTAYAADPVFRGFKQEQVSILTHGCITTLTACPSRMDPPSSQVLISQADQVQVIKGPHSFRYGPTTGAVVNFRLPEPVFSNGATSYTGRISTGFESNGEVYRTEGAIGFRAKKIAVNATGAYSIGHDYKDGYDTIIPAHFRRASVGLTADYKVKDANIISISASRNFTRDTDFPTLMMDQTSDDTWMLHAQYRNMPAHKWYKKWNTQLYHTSVDHVMSNIYRPMIMMKMTTEGHTKTSGLRSEMEVQKGRAQWIFGADFKNEAMADTMWQEANVSRGGIFTDAAVQKGAYKLSFAGRADVVSGKADYPFKKFVTIYQDLSRTDFNVSASVGIGRSWKNGWQAGAWFGHGARSASVAERYLNSYTIGLDNYEIIGNPQLKPEANNQADLMVAYRQKNTELSWNGFYSLATNYIYAVINPAIPKKNMISPGVRQYINIGKAIRYGFEGMWQQQWLPQLQQQFSVSYTWAQNAVTKLPLAEIAPFEMRYALNANFYSKKLMPYMQVRYSGKQSRVAADYGERTTDAFTIVDMGIRSQLVKNLQLSIAANNLFNMRYREPLSRYISKTKPLTAPGRSIVVMVAYSF